MMSLELQPWLHNEINGKPSERKTADWLDSALQPNCELTHNSPLANPHPQLLSSMFFLFWQVSITDYVVFDQGSLFQTLIHATQSVATATRAPVERVAECLRVAFLSQHSQCQPSLVSTNASGVWIASGRNDFHVAKGSLIGKAGVELEPNASLV